MSSRDRSRADPDPDRRSGQRRLALWRSGWGETNVPVASGDADQRPFRASVHEVVATRRLLVLFVLTLAWYALLAGDAVVGGGVGYWLAASATIAFYPAAVICVMLLLQCPAPPWLLRLPLSLGQRVVPILLVGVALALVIDLPADLSPSQPVGNDITASIICASRAVLHGADPYEESEVTCLHGLDAPITLGTPLQRGAFAHQRTYPTPTQMETAAARAEARGGRTSSFATFGYLPMSFVWMMPAALGGHQTWVGYTLLAAVALLALSGLGAGPLWAAFLLVLLAQIGDGGLMSAATQGDGEIFAYGAVVLGLVWLDRPRLSAFLLGLGMAWHPLIWVVWFGYAMFTRGLPDFRSRMVWSIGTAAVLTIPWIVLEHGAAAAILGLIFQPNFPSGIGLTLALGASPASIDRHVLLALVIVAYIALCAYAWRKPTFLSALPVVGLAFLWLSWRSDVSYLSELFPLAGAMTVGLFRIRTARAPGTANPGVSAVTT